MSVNPAVFLKNWFKSHYGFSVESEWLSECISFFKSENPNIPNQNLATNAFDQCLLADISDFCMPSLPRNIPSEMHTITGQYMLQMTQILDVSETAYDQLRRIQNRKLDEVEEPKENKFHNMKKNRMLKLELTDGLTTVSAMEYQPIKVLSTKLAPGVKIAIKGPLRCVNCVLLLESKNVQVLGGEVDTLLISNAYENVLLRILNKPLNPNPITNYEETEVKEEVKKPLPMPPVQPSTIKSVKRAPAFDDSDEDLGDIDLDAIIKKPAGEIKMASHSRSARVEPMEFDDLLNEDDDILDAIEQDIRAEHKHFESMAASSKPTTTQKTFVDNSVDYDIEMTNSAVINKTLDNLAAEFTEDWIPSSQPATRTHKQVAVVSPMNYRTPEDPPPDVESPAILNKNYKFRIEGLSLSTIDQLAECSSEQKLGKRFMLFAELDSITSPLRIRNGEWSLQAFITDHSVKLLEVKFQSDVITDLCGHDAKEMEQLRKKIASQPQLRDEIHDIMIRLKTLLDNLFCFVEIHYTDDDFVLLQRTITTKPNYMRILKNKIEAENLSGLRTVVVS